MTSHFLSEKDKKLIRTLAKDGEKHSSIANLVGVARSVVNYYANSAKYSAMRKKYK